MSFSQFKKKDSAFEVPHRYFGIVCQRTSFGMMMTMFFFFFLLVVTLLCVLTAADTTTRSLSCETVGNSRLIISEAGNYDVSCSRYSAEWYVTVIGCSFPSTSNNSSNDDKSVNVALLTSPTQVLVSDASPFISASLRGNLQDCHVNMEYRSNTLPRPDGNSLVHVLVVPSSHLASIAVTVRAAYHVTGKFLSINGFGCVNASVGVVSFTALPTSYVLCRTISGESTCNIDARSSLVVLEEMCPPVASVVIALNGTNITAMPTVSYFMLLTKDNATSGLSTTPPPLLHTILLHNVVGTFSGSNLIAFLQLLGPTVFPIGYPKFNGTINAANCVFDGSSLLNLFYFASIVALDMKLSGVTLHGLFLQLTVDANISEASVPPLQLILSNCTSSTAYVYVSVVGYWPSAPHYLVMITVVNTTIVSISPTTSMFELSTYNAALNVTPYQVSLFLSFDTCSLQLMNSAAMLLTVSATSHLTLVSGPLPVLVNSTISFRNVRWLQRWEALTYYSTLSGIVPYAPKTPMQLSNAINTSIEWAVCNVTVQKISTASSTPPALLMSAANVTGCRIAMSDVKASVLSTTQQLLRTALINSTGTATSNTVVDIKSSWFANLTALIATAVPAAVVGRPSLVLSLHCTDLPSSWCVATAAECATLESKVVLVSTNLHSFTALPTWVAWTQQCSVPTMSHEPTQPTRWLTLPSTSVSHSMWSLRLTLSDKSLPSDTLSLSEETMSLTRSASQLLAAAQQSFDAAAEHPLGVQIASVAVIAPMASAMLGSTVGGILQRTAVALQFANCPDQSTDASRAVRGQYMTVMENPTRLSFGDAEGAIYRGATVGNVVLFVATFVLATLFVLFGAYRQRRTNNNKRIDLMNDERWSETVACVMARHRLPGRAFVVYTVLLQATVTAATGLLFIGPESVGDVILAVVVLSCLCCFPLWLALVVHRGCSQLVEAIESTSPSASTGTIAWVFAWTSHRLIVWTPRESVQSAEAGDRGVKKTMIRTSSQTSEEGIHQRSRCCSFFTMSSAAIVAQAPYFPMQFDAFIGRVHSGTLRELYFLFGYTWSAASGLVVAALDPSTPSTCRTAQILFVVISSLAVIVMAAVQPYPSPFDFGVQLLLEILGLLSAVLVLADNDVAAQNVSYVQLAVSTLVTTVRLLSRMAPKMQPRVEKETLVNGVVRTESTSQPVLNLPGISTLGPTSSTPTVATHHDNVYRNWYDAEVQLMLTASDMPSQVGFGALRDRQQRHLIKLIVMIAEKNRPKNNK
ncbi:membrane-associated protein, putative [Bodo saltans]|uniref:Membrane-associated protein, putative n=1 Tax=Bodo saltans TaxID=75058 RepID=A0A0S4JDR6_BODSA|nr:membrane-associated protein, putative [Bodo saltans]|eukprot:CUG87323.1 membrane-associated protein, putative [Bodo saltans]